MKSNRQPIAAERGRLSLLQRQDSIKIIQSYLPFCLRAHLYLSGGAVIGIFSTIIMVVMIYLIISFFSCNSLIYRRQVNLPYLGPHCKSDQPPPPPQFSTVSIISIHTQYLYVESEHFFHHKVSQSKLTLHICITSFLSFTSCH